MAVPLEEDVTFDNRLTLLRSARGDVSPARTEERSRFRGANIQDAGHHNRAIVLQALRALGRAERWDLASITGLTAPAISKIARGLLSEGLVVNLGNREGSKGQPAAVLALNPDASFSIGVT